MVIKSIRPTWWQSSFRSWATTSKD